MPRFRAVTEQTSPAAEVPARKDVRLEETWDLEAIFPNSAGWEATFRATDARLADLKGYEGRVGESAATLLALLRLNDEVYEGVEHVQVYAALRRSEDTTNSEAAAMESRANGLLARYEAAAAFIRVETLGILPEQLIVWESEEPGLAVYRHLIDTFQRRREHTRSTEVEAVLAQASDVANVAIGLAQTFTDGELPYGTIKHDRGEPIVLKPGNLDRFLESPDRRLRQAAWEASADGHLAFKNTLAAALEGGIKRNVFYAKARNYGTAIEAALDEDAVSVAVFDNLIETIWKNLPVWHRYFRVRRQLLGLAEGDFHGWDITAPMANDPVVPFEEGMRLILESLAPMGEEYLEINRQGVADRWVDRCANLGKGAGAFSWGAYQTKPYISMVYNDTLGAVSTLTHELGHSLHSYYTWQHQPICYWRDGGGFLSEVPSNFHQAMLGPYLLEVRDDRDWVIAVIEERMANHLRYLFTMPILAQFERDCHTKIERGEALTADGMSATLANLYREGYGGEVVLDEKRMGITWARFPHLFMNYYVYEYSIGIAGAAALANQVRGEGAPAAKRVVEMLKTGTSAYPVAALKQAGVDMTSSEPVQAAFDVLSGYIDRLESFV